MTPSQTVVQQANSRVSTTDVKGRSLVLRRLTALDTLRLLKAAGPTLSQNEPWLAMAGLVFAIVEIDGVPVPPPVTEHQIESLVDRLGEEGLEAIAQCLKVEQTTGSRETDVGNLPSTLF